MSSRRLILAFATAAALVAALPATAQSVRPPRHSRVGATSQHVFVPNFGLRPVIHERFPVFGLGFDAHHFHALRRHHGFNARFGFRGKRFFFQGGFGRGFFPSAGFTPFFGGTSTVVVQQPVPTQPTVIIIKDDDNEENSAPRESADVPVGFGLPFNWNQVRVAEPSYARQSERPLRQLTLLVLKDETILAATEYWLEDGRVFYVTSSGRRGSFAVRELDWEMTSELNKQRNVTFILRAAP